MAPFASVLASAALLTGSFMECGASGFLEASTTPTISQESVEEALMLELAARRNSGQLAEIEASMRDMYMALPKNEDGRLHAATVRYALHRYFVQKHGWYMRGLEGSGDWAPSADGNIFKDKAPALVQSLMEKHLQGKGMGLRELAIFAATMGDLVHQEATGLLHGFFQSMKLDEGGPSPREKTDIAVKAFLVSYLLLGSEFTDLTAEELAAVEPGVQDIYSGWSDTYMWVQDLRLSQDLELRSRRNPFVEPQDSFTDTADFVQHLGHGFGGFQNLECRGLKNELLDREFQGTGRVPLSRFYTSSSEDWKFLESVDYLRNLGVLDESDRQRPSVMIANYITSPTNCLKSSGFYSVCCLNECEGLMGKVEREVEAPTATPRQLLDVISNLPSDSVDAPRNLSSVLVSRLDDIAARHKGSVPLYGRLFAQWMHHAYPRECPFPHVSGTSSPVSPEEWMALKGEDALDVTEEEMKVHVETEDLPLEMSEDSLPWDAIEELLIGDQHTSRSIWASLRPYAGFSLLGASVALVLRLMPSSKQSKKQADCEHKFFV
jgi:hypothetical protein